MFATMQEAIENYKRIIKKGFSREWRQSHPGQGSPLTRKEWKALAKIELEALEAGLGLTNDEIRQFRREAMNEHRAARRTTE